MERTTISLAGVLAATALAVAACGGSNGGYGGGSSSSSSSSSPTMGATGSTSGSQTAAHLTTSSGLAVYLFALDTDGKSHCYGGCATAWPPVSAGTKLATTSGAVSSGMLGTTTRTDGSKQLTYDGHPLYRYVADTSSGQTSGQGLNVSGGLWWLVSPKGSAITTKSGGSSPGSGSSSGGGGGGGYGY